MHAACREKTKADVKVDLLLAMNWIREAWNYVTVQTISNCFKKAGFNREGENSEEDAILPTGTHSDSVEQLDEETVQFDEWVSADDNIRVHDEMQTDDTEEEEDNEEEDGEVEEEITDIPSFADARNALSIKLRKYSLFVNLHPNMDAL